MKPPFFWHVDHMSPFMRQVMKCDESPIIALNISFSYERYLSSPLSALTAVFRSPPPRTGITAFIFALLSVAFLRNKQRRFAGGGKNRIDGFQRRSNFPIGIDGRAQREMRYVDG